MKVYDTANQLAEEIKKSEEYVTYKTTREIINLKPDLKEKLKQFEEKRYKLQIEMMQNGKENSDNSKELQNLYAELIEIDEAKKYFEAELKFNVMLADVNKIIGNAVKDLM